jgi:hypothetical protein
MYFAPLQHFGLLIDLDRDPPAVQLVTVGLALDGWEILHEGAEFVIREHREVGLKVNLKPLSRCELVDHDEIEAHGQRYLWKDFVRFPK